MLNIIIDEQVNCRSNHLNSQVHNFYQIQIPIPITKIPLKTRLINFFSKEKTCGTWTSMVDKRACRGTLWLYNLIKRFNNAPEANKMPIDMDFSFEGVSGLVSPYKLSWIVCHLGDYMNGGHFLQKISELAQIKWHEYC